MLLRLITVLSFIGILNLPVMAQKAITLEDIWENGTFREKRVPGFNFLNDGKHYSRLTDNAIKKYDITNGGFVGDILVGESLKSMDGFGGEIESYALNSDESMILLESNVKEIYRHSYTANYHIYDVNSKKLISVYDEPVMNASVSPDKSKVAFVFENNIYVKSLKDGEIQQITKDGEKNKIINGITDWVYEEEFAFVQAFHWSPLGNNIAYIKFDESEVTEFTMTMYDDNIYPEYVTWKYPKVGEDNAKVSVHVYNLKKNETTKVKLPEYEYIPRIKWTQNDDQLCVFTMNRHQSNLKLNLADANSGISSLLLEENNKYYIDITDNLTFFGDGNQFIWTSELDGYNHIYLYDMNGKMKNQITKGNYDVTEFYGVNENTGTVYYQAAEKSPMEKEVYSISLDGKNKKQLSIKEGYNSAQFSSTYDYYVLKHGSINHPSSYIVYNHDKKEVRAIEDNKKLASKQVEYDTAPMEFFNFTTTENVTLNGWMLKPNDFDKSKKYPVFMYLYGGPNSQQVTDSWKGSNYWWFQMLAQNGYIVACVDNRGTGARGEEFRKMTYLQLGHYETIDQIEAAKYLGSLDYTDKERIGIFGWSYGGYMSSLCLLKGNDVFKAAIAVAPVTSWKWYDTIYTERFMRTLEENKDGYEDNSPIYFADQLKGNYLLVHGMGDDNVHFQNSVEMAAALIKANKQFDTYYYPNRNHGIYGDNARIHLYTKMTDFLYEKL